MLTRPCYVCVEVSHDLEDHIINWFDYQWHSGLQMHREESVLDELPEKLKAEIAMNVHLDTLKRVAIFQVTIRHAVPPPHVSHINFPLQDQTTHSAPVVL